MSNLTGPQMRRRGRLIVLLGLVLVATLPGVTADEVTLSGSYVWERSDKSIDGELEAVFVPAGKREWTVAFRFDWEGKPHVFEGTARGSLTGELIGNVASDDPGHPLEFEFKGAFAEGTFTGTHGYFKKSGDLAHSGTLELAAVKPPPSAEQP